MARRMKATAEPPTAQNVLVVEVNPLAVPRGHRQLKRGGVHQSDRQPSRAKSKARWRRDSASGLDSAERAR